MRAELAISSQDQQLATAQPQPAFSRGQPANVRDVASLARRGDPAQLRLRNEVCRLATLRDRARGRAAHNPPIALRFPRVLQPDAIPRLQLVQPARGDLQGYIDLAGRVWRSVCAQADAGGPSHAPILIPARPHLEHRRSEAERGRSQLRPRQVHEDSAVATECGAGAPNVLDHFFPHHAVVVRAVDARAAHAGGDEFVDQSRIRPGLVRHGHHDARGAMGGCRSEQADRVLLEQASSGGEGQRVRRRQMRRFAQRSNGDHASLLDGCQRVRLAPAQRRQAERGQHVLQRTQVTCAQCQVVQQISSALPETGSRLVKAVRAGLLQLQHCPAQSLQPLDDQSQPIRIRRSHRIGFHGGRSLVHPRMSLDHP